MLLVLEKKSLNLYQIFGANHQFSLITIKYKLTLENNLIFRKFLNM